MHQRKATPSLFYRPQSTYTDFEDAWSDTESRFEEMDSPRESFDSVCLPRRCSDAFPSLTLAVRAEPDDHDQLQCHHSGHGAERLV